MTDIRPEPGVLLVAAPMLADPNFHRSVVLICEHTPDGSFGLIINRLLEATPADVINGMATYDGALLLGGPVQTDTLHFLDRKSTRLNSSHVAISYAVFCLTKK